MSISFFGGPNGRQTYTFILESKVRGADRVGPLFATPESRLPLVTLLDPLRSTGASGFTYEQPKRADGVIGSARVEAYRAAETTCGIRVPGASAGGFTGRQG